MCSGLAICSFNCRIDSLYLCFPYFFFIAGQSKQTSGTADSYDTFAIIIMVAFYYMSLLFGWSYDSILLLYGINVLINVLLKYNGLNTPACLTKPMQIT